MLDAALREMNELMEHSYLLSPAEMTAGLAMIRQKYLPDQLGPKLVEPDGVLALLLAARERP